MKPLTAIAPAKINLGLWILRRRPDGYHDILTLFQALDLSDRLSVEAASRGLKMTTDDPSLPVDDRNLVLKAARLLAGESGIRTGARFHLTKRIPTGAGLGGGSSDAAAALVLLNSLWGLGWPVSRLARIAAAVGSDVPFFLVGGTALGRGRGGRLVPLRAGRGLWFLLVHGTEPISAKRAYSNYKRELTGSKPPPRIATLESGNRLDKRIIKEIDNQLEPGLVHIFPDITQRTDALLKAGAVKAQLTGSGSTVFGVFDRFDLAGRARIHFLKTGFPVDLCQSVSHGVVLATQAAGST